MQSHPNMSKNFPTYFYVVSRPTKLPCFNTTKIGYIFVKKMQLYVKTSHSLQPNAIPFNTTKIGYIFVKKMLRFLGLRKRSYI